MNLEANKEALLEAIKAERAYQDAKWGPLSERKFKSLAGWYLIAREELLQFVASCYAHFEQSGEELDRSLLQWHLDEGAPSLEDRLVEIEVRIDGVKREMPNKKSGASPVRLLKALVGPALQPTQCHPENIPQRARGGQAAIRRIQARCDSLPGVLARRVVSKQPQGVWIFSAVNSRDINRALKRLKAKGRETDITSEELCDEMGIPRDRAQWYPDKEERKS